MSSRYNKIELSKKHHRSSKAVRTSYKGRAVRTSSKGTRCPHEACRSCDRKESDRLRQSAQPGGTCSRDRIYFSQTVIHLGWRRWLLGGGCQPTALPGRNRTLQRRRRCGVDGPGSTCTAFRRINTSAAQASPQPFHRALAAASKGHSALRHRNPIATVSSNPDTQ
jgi:hypothetical protein